MENHDVDNNLNKDKEIDETLENENDVDSDIEEESDDNSNEDYFTYTVDNNNVNNDYNKFNYDDKKSFIYIIIGVAVLIGIIVFIVVFVNKAGSKNSGFSDIENKMVDGAKSYYKKNQNLLPSSDGTYVTVDSETLISNSYLKPFSEMTEGSTSCSGEVMVYKNNEDYVYFPFLDCGEQYKSVSLSEKIISSSVVTSGDGLYNLGEEYIFRGEYPNNYVSFDDKVWRIIKINSDGTIRMILIGEKIEKYAWDDRYNISNNSNSGINDFGVSRLKEYLINLYEKNTFVSKTNQNLLVKTPWCIGKASQNDVAISSLNLCSEVYSDLYIGTLQMDDVLKASIDKNCINIYDGACTNYNYFTLIPSTWTMNASSDKSYNVFYASGGTVTYKKASSISNVRPVININANVLYKSGDGTEKNPYVLGE